MDYVTNFCGWAASSMSSSGGPVEATSLPKAQSQRISSPDDSTTTAGAIGHTLIATLISPPHANIPTRRRLREPAPILPAL